MLWASWLKNSNMEENFLGISVIPLQWWVDFFYRPLLDFFRSFYFSNQVLNVRVNFFMAVSRIGYIHFFIIFIFLMKTSVFKTCNV
jgi:hypothetical protein